MLGPCVKTMTSLLSKQVATGRDFKVRTLVVWKSRVVV